MDISITRMAVAENVKGAKTSADYEQWEADSPRTSCAPWAESRSSLTGYYGARASSARTSPRARAFPRTTWRSFWEALLGMYEHDRSASKGLMSVRELFVFKHVGTDTTPTQRVRQSYARPPPKGCSTSPGRDSQPRRTPSSRSITGTGPGRVPLAPSPIMVVRTHPERLPAGVELLIDGKAGTDPA